MAAAKLLCISPQNHYPSVFLFFSEHNPCPRDNWNWTSLIYMTRIGKSRTKTVGREMPFLFFPKVILSRLCDNSVFNTQGTDCVLRVNQTSLKTFFFFFCEVWIPGNCTLYPLHLPLHPSHLKQSFTNKDVEFVLRRIWLKQQREQVQGETAWKAFSIDHVVGVHPPIPRPLSAPSSPCLRPPLLQIISAVLSASPIGSPSPLIDSPTRCFCHVQLQRGVLVNAH